MLGFICSLRCMFSWISGDSADTELKLMSGRHRAKTDERKQRVYARCRMMRTLAQKKKKKDAGASSENPDPHGGVD